MHALDLAVVAVHGTHARFIADLDAALERDLAQLGQQADAAPDRMEIPPDLEIELVADRHGLLGLPRHAHLFHPVNGLVRGVDQALGEHRIDAALGDAGKIGQKLLSGIGRNVHLAEGGLVELRNERAHLLGAGMHETKAHVGIARIAAELRLGRLLQAQHAFGARLPGGDRRFQGGAAAADDDDVVSFWTTHLQLLPPVLPGTSLVQGILVGV